MAIKKWLRERSAAALGDRGRGELRRAFHTLGLRPSVNEAAAHSVQWPDGKRAAVVISADLELAWGWRYTRWGPDPVVYAERMARLGRGNVGPVLDLCGQYGFPITWAVVGHLFLRHCSRLVDSPHPELPRIAYFSNKYWSYRRGDWFDSDPGSPDASHADWPYWYGPDLIQRILDDPIAHEIGCHSFSHVPLSDEHCSPEVATAELRLSQQLAGEWGLALRSLVFPGNLAGNYRSVRDAGFTAYRAHGRYELDAPIRDPLGLWQVPGGVWLEKPYASWTEVEYAALVRSVIDTAIDRGLLCGLWFHPETDPRNVDEILPRVFDHLASRSASVWLTTMGGLTQWLAESDSPSVTLAAKR